ncbi:unnamed protein product [Adineta steineri]|uniref:Uncharacterized protein n=2 Tax=Adineta steineri TaxID=433720 RepID=A0A814KA33_9BILA|nr:unnamed protein product [Adineta steineri]
MLFNKIYFFLLIITINGIHLYKEEIIRAHHTYDKYQFNILHHLSGIAPYFESNTDELNPDPPEGCKVDKTAYLIRHGSVYVDDYDYDYIINPFLKRLSKAVKYVDFSKLPKLSFLNKWTSPVTNPKQQIERLTKSGIFEALELGMKLSYRYEKLLPKVNQTSFKIWTSSSKRTKQSALAIIQGLFSGRKLNGKVIDIPEDKKRGANTLTPTKSCQKYNASKGSQEANIWLQHYSKSILKKFNSKIFNWNFIPNDILAMQQLCGYETVIRGYSPFCSLFTTEEWMSFEYYFDIKYYHEIFYGNYLSPYLGMPWVKATTDLLSNDILNNQNMYLTVTHREMLPVILAALGLYNESEYSNEKVFPLDEINHERIWRASKVIPFLGRVALERLNCSSSHSNELFIRILVNSSVKPIPGCTQGPGESCHLNQFINYINKRYHSYKDFTEVCQIKKTNHSIDQLTFYNKKH